MNGIREIGLSVLTGDVEERGRIVTVERAVLARNDEVARSNRTMFERHGLLVLNVVSSPGSGKTELIARTVAHLAAAGRSRAGVIVGDLATDNDAMRLHAVGAETVQITTGGTCHLEAPMIAAAAERLRLDRLELLVIENVGNLVCPAAFDLGETSRVVLLSVTEGDDKPLKYPTIFKSADAVVLTKLDLATAAGADLNSMRRHIRNVAPQARRFETSSRTGQGLEEWHAFVADRLAEARADRNATGIGV